MSGEHIKGIIYAGMRAPIDGHVADECNDKGYENALSDCNITSRRCDGYKTNYATYGCPHSRRFTATQTIEKYPRHHGCGRGCVGVQKSLDGLSVGMQRRTSIETKPA